MNGCILIVSRNNLALTKAAVRTALAQDVECLVMVVDNASEDGTQAWLHSKQGICTSLFTEQKSLAYCWNWGLKMFHGIGADEVLVCNNDIQLRPDTYRLLASHGSPFVTCVSVDDPTRIGTPGDRDIDSLRQTERPHPDFSCFMIRRECVIRTGWFNEEYYPAYVEDCEYHVRMHRAGVRAICVDLPFYHAGAQTVKTATEFERARIGRLAQKNRDRFKSVYGCLPGTPEYSELFK